jgi:hypothetical protein
VEEVSAPMPFVRKRAGLIAGFTLVGVWVMFFRFWPLGGLAVLAIGIALGFHSRKASLTLLLCSPFVVVPLLSLAGGVLGYLTGKGCFQAHGLPHAEFDNLDPKYRCYRSSSG